MRNVRWIYDQKTGVLSRNREKVAVGYSGYGRGKNNPKYESTKNVGPIPRGLYRITPPYHHPTKGPVVMRLLPQQGTSLHGRSGFLIHGDSSVSPGSASQGCIVLPRWVRELIANGGSDELEVE